MVKIKILKDALNAPKWKPYFKLSPIEKTI